MQQRLRRKFTARRLHDGRFSSWDLPRGRNFHASRAGGAAAFIWKIKNNRFVAVFRFLADYDSKLDQKNTYPLQPTAHLAASMVSTTVGQVFEQPPVISNLSPWPYCNHQNRKISFVVDVSAEKLTVAPSPLEEIWPAISSLPFFLESKNIVDQNRNL